MYTLTLVRQNAIYVLKFDADYNYQVFDRDDNQVDIKLTDKEEQQALEAIERHKMVK